ncbi:MAG TPA: HAMP domain-containing sensor histidine kinase [Solirubrobacterales bacterium]|nr:HAMP domain-containing sensor histidine kinase [Solirubrobacterales bacterium]
MRGSDRPPPWRWRDPQAFLAGHRRRPPHFVRRMGCAFAALIGLAALGASTLVSLLWRSPQRLAVIVAVGVALVATLALVFRRTIGRVGRAFAEQDRLRRQLLADVAHELRTPLAILQGRIEGMLDGVYPRDETHLGELLDETRHLSRLVEDLGTLAHAEAGALELRKETVDLGDLVRDVAASLPRPVTVVAPPDLPTVEADPVRIRQVLLNLLANAIRHTPAEGTVAVEVEALPQRILLRVRDSGSGIAPEDLPRIFERFQKGSDSGGSGLGLAIARKLVLAHGGDIGIESTPGKGTEVTVTLPR